MLLRGIGFYINVFLRFKIIAETPLRGTRYTSCIGNFNSHEIEVIEPLPGSIHAPTRNRNTNFLEKSFYALNN